jgi:DNA-binding beta-propeller fold protein YncE
MTSSEPTIPSRRDFLRAAVAVAGAATVIAPRRSWAQAEGEALAGEFVGPWGVAFDPAGNLFVSDPGAYAIAVFAPDGKLLRRFGQPGASTSGFNFPTGLCVYGERLYVCDTNNGRIAVCDLDGNRVGHIGSLGITTARLAMPSGLWATEPWLWVANTRGHVLQRYERATGRLDHAFGRLGDDAGSLAAGTIDYRLRQPTAVTVDEQGVVYLLDSKHARLLAVDGEGALLWESRPVHGGLPLVRPQGLAYGEGALYVADTGNNRLLKLDRQGRVAEVRAGVADPHGLAVAPDRLAVAQRKERAVRLMSVF